MDIWILPLRVMASSGDALLTVAQSLFMLLPVCSLYAKRCGVAAPCHGPQLVSMAAASIAFACLVMMFRPPEPVTGAPFRALRGCSAPRVEPHARSRYAGTALTARSHPP